MRVICLGGDGFCGWPTALHLSASGHEVTVVDNFARRRADEELGAGSLTPIASLETRLAAWTEATGLRIGFSCVDVAADYESLVGLLTEAKPHAVVHFAEQRSAPYSMKSPAHRRATIDNNVDATHNLLAALAETRQDVHVVHLGTMGVYGYESVPMDIPEGYLEVTYPDRDGLLHHREILYPTRPGSVYHLSKSLDQVMFQFYAQNDGIRITDLHQGIVWGTQTDETCRDPRLINRFDYDGDYGTVLNRFLVEAAVGHPLTVHGSGGQTRAFIHIRDSVRCIRMAVESGDAVDDRVRVMNQMTETHRVADLARLVADEFGAQIGTVINPRLEADANELSARNDSLRLLGLDPIPLSSGLLADEYDLALRYSDRVDRDRIPCRSYWNEGRRTAAEAGRT